MYGVPVYDGVRRQLPKYARIERTIAFRPWRGNVDVIWDRLADFEVWWGAASWLTIYKDVFAIDELGGCQTVRLSDHGQVGE